MESQAAIYNMLKEDIDWHRSIITTYIVKVENIYKTVRMVLFLLKMFCIRQKPVLNPKNKQTNKKS